nr:MAG: hypothetical protein DIU64_11785 [Caldicoprobacter oshimai]
MWSRIMDKLEEKGLNPYAPGMYEGVCQERFCIVRMSSQMPMAGTNKVGTKLFDIIVYVPKTRYPDIEPYMQEIKEAMKELNFIRPTGNETPPVPDDEKEAFTASIEYQVLKKL